MARADRGLSPGDQAQINIRLDALQRRVSP
jgi:hypothetical protein